MHAHLLQYRHWLRQAGGRLNNVILLTPNEQMSAQHERELRESDLHARIFSSDAGPDLFPTVEIIDPNQLGNCSPGGSTGYSLSWLRQSTAFPCRAMVVAVSGL